MKVFVTVLVLVALAQAKRAKRQIIGGVGVGGTSNPFQNVPNPCVNNPTNQIYFPHPTDSTKFLQCDNFKRMYIIQCPQGEVYVQATTSCRPPQVLTSSLPQIVVTPVMGSNACHSSNQAAGQIYFSISNDPTHYLECDLLGNSNILACPSGKVWQQSMVSCVFPQGSGQLPSPSTVTGVTNPCTPQAITANKLYFPHPDPTKFIQCDLWGDFYVNTCPTGLVYNAYSEVCSYSFQSGVGK